MSDSHHNHDPHENKSHSTSQNTFMDKFISLTNIFDGPATFFKGKIF